MTRDAHVWDESTDLLAHSVLGYAVERLKVPKDSAWGAQPADALDAALAHSISAHGIGGHDALRLFRDVILPACRPMDDPMNLSYVPTAPTPAATLFDLIVSASSIFGGNWEAGAGAIAAENAALRWLADLAGYPTDSGGVFVSGGSAANLAALVTARDQFRQRAASSGSPPPAGRLAFAATTEVHASVRASARVMDVDVVEVPADDAGRMTAAHLAAALDASPCTVFAVVATGGTTNAGMIDELDGIAAVCEQRGLWLHVDGAYGLAALCAPSVRHCFNGIERSDSFGLDPHKWLFAPYDCAAVIYRHPRAAALAHAQHGDYLDAIDRNEWNPSDYAYHLSRRARGLPLWFSLATYGTDAYRSAVERTIEVAHGFAAAVRTREGFTLLVEPQLSVVLFTRDGWTFEHYAAWSRVRAREGRYLVVPTRWRGESCVRICVINPRTELAALEAILDDLAATSPSGFPLRP
jgi:glutamate/tyrosine decarboxylase-like PLP-dependent enzyme